MTPAAGDHPTRLCRLSLNLALPVIKLWCSRAGSYSGQSPCLQTPVLKYSFRLDAVISPSDPGVTVRLFIRITYRAFFLRLTISRILAETHCLRCRRRADR